MTLNHRKDFTGSLVMHFVWKSRKVKKTPIWNFISFWTGLDRTLASKLIKGHFSSIKLWSSYNMPSKYSTWPHISLQCQFQWSSYEQIWAAKGLFDKGVLEGVLPEVVCLDLFLSWYNLICTCVCKFLSSSFPLIFLLLFLHFLDYCIYVCSILTCLASKPFPHRSHPRKNRTPTKTYKNRSHQPSARFFSIKAVRNLEVVTSGGSWLQFLPIWKNGFKGAPSTAKEELWAPWVAHPLTIFNVHRGL